MGRARASIESSRPAVLDPAELVLRPSRVRGSESRGQNRVCPPGLVFRVSDGIRGEHLQFVLGRDNRHDPSQRGEVNAPVRRHGRRIKIALRPDAFLLEDGFAGGGIQVGQSTALRDEVQTVAVIQWGSDPRCAIVGRSSSPRLLRGLVRLRVLGTTAFHGIEVRVESCGEMWRHVTIQGPNAAKRTKKDAERTRDFVFISRE
jgi:hypothetical protein